MPTLTVDSFKQGLDLRRLAAVSGAGLQEAVNVHVNKGGQIERRPPLIYDTAIDRKLFGPFPGLGSLWLFHGEAQAPANPDPARFTVQSLRTFAGSPLLAVWFCRPFWRASGTVLYVVALYSGNHIRHLLVNASTATRVADANAPTSKAELLIAGSRVFVADGPIVRFCKVGDPTNWSGADDAGFLPAGRAAGGRDRTTGLGLYDEKLVVFFADALQVWRLDPNPANMALVQHVEGVGTKHPRSVAQIGGHTLFLTDDGYKLLDTERESQRIIVRDVGAPIDALVRGRNLPNSNDVAGDNRGGPLGVYGETFDQYLCFWAKNTCDVYSFSRQDRRAAWTVYEFPLALREVVAVGSSLYLRDDDSGALYRMDARPARGQSWRDTAAADDMPTEYPLATAAQWEAVFEGAMPASWRAYAGVAARAAGERGTRNAGTGPSKITNTVGDFLSFESAPRAVPLPARDDRFEIEAALLGGTGPGRSLTLEYCAQGFYQRRIPYYRSETGNYLSYGLVGSLIDIWIETSDDAGDSWNEGYSVLTGWRYGDWYQGAYVRDFEWNYFTVSAAGGWRRATIPLPASATKVRLRVVRHNLEHLFDFRALAPHSESNDVTLDLCLRRIWVASGGMGYRSSVVLPFLDAKRPGVGKQWLGARVIQDGECDLSFRYRVPDPDGGVEIRETAARRARGGERAQPLHAIGLAARDLAPVLASAGDMPWTLGAVDLEFQYLNAWS